MTTLRPPRWASVRVAVLKNLPPSNSLTDCTRNITDENRRPLPTVDTRVGRRRFEAAGGIQRFDDICTRIIVDCGRSPKEEKAYGRTILREFKHEDLSNENSDQSSRP
jgi:hypothetical protein